MVLCILLPFCEVAKVEHHKFDKNEVPVNKPHFAQLASDFLHSEDVDASLPNQNDNLIKSFLSSAQNQQLTSE